MSREQAMRGVRVEEEKGGEEGRKGVCHGKHRTRSSHAPLSRPVTHARTPHNPPDTLGQKPSKHPKCAKLLSHDLQVAPTPTRLPGDVFEVFPKRT
jgi:hypothetical protein